MHIVGLTTKGGEIVKRSPSSPSLSGFMARKTEPSRGHGARQPSPVTCWVPPGDSGRSSLKREMGYMASEMHKLAERSLWDYYDEGAYTDNGAEIHVLSLFTAAAFPQCHLRKFVRGELKV